MIKINRAFLIVAIVCPALVSGAETNSAGAVAMRKILVDAGAPKPMSMTVPIRTKEGVPRMELMEVVAMNEQVTVRLRCRQRRECGETVATLRYGGPGEAQTARGALLRGKGVIVPRAARVIRAGTHVVLTLANERMLLRLRVDALNSGSIGERIRVRDRESHRIYLAIVTGPGEVKGEL